MDLIVYIFIVLSVVVILYKFVWRKYFSINETDKPTIQNQTEFRKAEIEEINEFHLIDKNSNLPVISFKRMGSSEINNLSLENVDSDFNPILSPILQQLPLLTKNVSDLFSTTYSLKVNSALLSGLNSGKLELMGSQQYQGFVRGIIIDPKTGKIVGQGNFKPASGINPATTALIVWQIMAVITAQKFLSDINKKLEFIKAGVEQIISFHKNEWWGKFSGNMVILNKFLTVLQNPSTTYEEKQACLNQIENIETQFHQLIEITNKNMAYSKTILLNKNISGTGLEEHTNEFVGLSNEIMEYQKLSLSLHYGLQATNTLKFGLPVDKKNVLDRNTNLKNHFSSQLNLHKEINDSIKNKIPQLKGSWSSVETDKSKQAYVSDNLNNHLLLNTNIEKEIFEFAEKVKQKAEFLISNKSEDEFFIETDKTGQIQSVKRFSKENYD